MSRTTFMLAAAAATALGTVGGLAVVGQAQAQAGSFQGSCRNIKSSNGMVTAECADTGGHYRFSSLPYTTCKGDIGNNNGMLSCNGAVSSGGNVINGNGGRDDRGAGGYRDNGGRNTDGRDNGRRDNYGRDDGRGGGYDRDRRDNDRDDGYRR